jgi:hypothetical protein
MTNAADMKNIVAALAVSRVGGIAPLAAWPGPNVR